MRWLVTGGLGFIGSHFVRLALRERGTLEIVNFDAITYAGNPANLRDVESHPRYRFVKGDICDAAAVRSVLGDGVDAIVNFAAETHVDRSIVDPEAFLRTDALGTHVLLQALREHAVPRYLQVSTDEVYGNVTSGESLETDPLRPRSPYAASQGGRRFARARLSRNVRCSGAADARQQYLRAEPVPRKARAPLYYELARRHIRARVRRRPADSRLALRRGPRARDSHGSRSRRGRKRLQRVERNAADKYRVDGHPRSRMRALDRDTRRARHGSPRPRSAVRRELGEAARAGVATSHRFRYRYRSDHRMVSATNESWWRPLKARSDRASCDRMQRS